VASVRVDLSVGDARRGWKGSEWMKRMWLDGETYLGEKIWGNRVHDTYAAVAKPQRKSFGRDIFEGVEMEN
jgi:hypothetical protein